MQREYPSSPLVGVGAVVVHEGRVLLVQRGTEPAKGQWSIPGGLIDVGESLREAVIREVREETGLIVEPVELIELLDRIYREDDRVRYHYVIADYLCRVIGGALVAASDADAVRWVERAEWNSHNHPSDKDPSLGTPDNHPSDKDPSLGPPDNHPSDKDPSLGPPDSILRIDPVTSRVIEAGWQRAKNLQVQAGEKL